MGWIPTPESITAEWLGERLREAGHADAEVRRFRAERIGTGQLGRCIRFSLELAGGDASTPRSLVGKFPSDDETSLRTAEHLRAYEKEVCFYRELQPRLTISTPRCYFAQCGSTPSSFALLLEDLAPARQGDQLAGCSAEVARAAVLELVGLHAPTWCDESLLGVEWLGQPSEQTVEIGRMLYGAQLPGFLERYGRHLADDEAGIIERVGRSRGAPFELLREPWSLVHVDYRLDNLLIDETREPPRVTAVDWQSVTLASPLADVAYFLGAGLQPERRREIEQDVVRAYHAALGEAGVEGYEWESCWRDYRRGAFSGFGVTVIASMLVEQTERGDEMFIAMARRHARHALDLGADEFLG